ncbi:MAG: zinc ribbon domain-containing protein [Acidobacteria bacterium]|nr:MAG: zinc ribbon domain-containing protein [Acidobacteriota bacterium]
MNYCPHCGASIGGTAAFCSGCGKSLSAAAKPVHLVAAGVVALSLLVGILWATMGSNSADRRRGGPVASADEVETAADVASPDVVVEEPGFVGKLLGQKPRVFLTIGDGEPLALELTSAISTETATSGDTFTATLVKAILVDDREALPRGTELSGHIAHAQRSDKVKGRAALTLELDRLVLGDGEELLIEAEPMRFEAQSTTKKDATKIGGAAGAGALIGAIFGGKKGAAIGAGVGAGAGTGVVLSTRGDELVLPEGTQLKTNLTTTLTVEQME